MKKIIFLFLFLSFCFLSFSASLSISVEEFTEIQSNNSLLFILMAISFVSFMLSSILYYVYHKYTLGGVLLIISTLLMIISIYCLSLKTGIISSILPILIIAIDEFETNDPFAQGLIFYSIFFLSFISAHLLLN